ncbi:pyocin knob domain-containing protein [Mitsuokella multacida]|uniref:Putative tail fiber protein gp53-like C-terminal domain-containing protein n=1 Tax=Mitsuokella multacida TaxID=52226 RepID=A0A414NWF4_9FIRM|nr:pyocin knob domain-containing protein [Mitsuokella multacida]RHF51479.1 hypothetical protein DW674_06865 [Mitsuokella multacida]
MIKIMGFRRDKVSMQNYKEINGNDYVKDSRTTINETMRSIQSMNSGTVFPTTNLFEGMKCYRTDLKKTYTLTDVENNTWVEDAHAALADEATHAASATKLQTPRALNLSGAVTADAASFDGTADATINVKTLDASKLKGTASVSTTGNAATATKLATARTIALSGNASGSATFDGSGNATINATVSESAHATKATQDTNGRAFTDTNAYMHISKLADGTDFNNVKTTGIYACSNDNYLNRPLSSWGVLRVYYISDNYKQEYIPDNRNEVWVRYFTAGSWNAWSKVAASTADTCMGNAATASKLASPRTLSLTGKAAGSISFDGSSNAAINVTSVNADTASKLSTARKINLTGNATGAANFDGSGDANISVTVNESKHAAAATTVNATAPNGGAADLAFGTMAVNDYARIRVYGKDDNGALEIATADAGTEPIYARQYGGSYDWPNGRPGTVVNEAAILDGNGNTKFPKNVTAASFTGPLNGNATSATTAGNVSGKIYYSDDSPSVATDKLFTVKQAHAGDDNVPNNGLVIQSGPTGANYNGKLYITDNGGDGVWVGGVAAGKEVGWTRLVENKGSWNINAATATKLQTPRTISLSGNASGSATFDGSGNISINTNVSMADTVDGYHESSFLRYRGAAAANGEDTYWSQIGIKEYDNVLPESLNDTYAYGAVISFPSANSRLDIWYDCYASDRGTGLYYRTGWQNDKKAWARLLDSNNYTKWAPTKTGSGASGTWPISISGNADTVDGYHASDIINRITAANTGGIVAASLTANGYVKFANGLILQWGFVSNTKAAKNYDITFPVSFASACFGVHNTYFKSSGEAGKSGDNWDTVAKITKYGCQLSADNQNVFWTAIGV